MTEPEALLRQLTEASGVSGHELEIRDVIHAALTPLVDRLHEDALGNLIGFKRGASGRTDAPSVLIACHQDEIGLMITHVEEGGFLRFTGVGGWDARVLLAQPVWVHAPGAGSDETGHPARLPGVVGSRPPHVLPAAKKDEVIPMDELYIDLGLAEETVRSQVHVGDVVTLRRRTRSIAGGRFAGKSMDNRASVMAMILAMGELLRLKHDWDVYAVATVQEEVGLKGAMTAAFGLTPTVAVALDVTFAKQPSASDLSISLGGGPVVSFGPNIHPKLFERFTATGQQLELDLQVEPVPGDSGTDAWAIQVAGMGVPTALLGIPVRYMHTTVETLALKDVERTGRLLAHFIAGLELEDTTSFAESADDWFDDKPVTQAAGGAA